MTTMVFHNPDARVSIAIRVNSAGKARLAIAACHPKDTFIKRRAYNAVTKRLDRPTKFVELSGEFKPPIPLNQCLFHPARDAVRALGRRRDVKSIASAINRAVNLAIEDYKKNPMSGSTQKNTAAPQKVTPPLPW